MLTSTITVVLLHYPVRYDAGSDVLGHLWFCNFDATQCQAPRFDGAYIREHLGAGDFFVSDLALARRYLLDLLLHHGFSDVLINIVPMLLGFDRRDDSGACFNIDPLYHAHVGGVRDIRSTKRRVLAYRPCIVRNNVRTVHCLAPEFTRESLRDACLYGGSCSHGFDPRHFTSAQHVTRAGGVARCRAALQALRALIELVAKHDGDVARFAAGASGGHRVLGICWRKLRSSIALMLAAYCMASI